MDKTYVEKVIEKLESEREIHDTKFADAEAHRDCRKNFDRIIEKLKSDIDKFGSSPKTDPAEHTAAGDIGDEQMPAGEIKTDKKEWSMDSTKIKVVDLPKCVKDFVAGL